MSWGLGNGPGDVRFDEKFTAQAGEPFAAQGEDLVADSERKQVIERLVTHKGHARAGDKAESLPAAQAPGLSSCTSRMTTRCPARN